MPRIVILGGVYAGVYAARQLEKRLKGRDDVEIVLVNKENYFVFQPLLPEVITSPASSPGSCGARSTS